MYHPEIKKRMIQNSWAIKHQNEAQSDHRKKLWRMEAAKSVTPFTKMATNGIRFLHHSENRNASHADAK